MRDNRNLMHRRGILRYRGDQGMTDFMIRDNPFFLFGNDRAFAFLPGDHRIDRFVKVMLHDLGMTVTHGR